MICSSRRQGIYDDDDDDDHSFANPNSETETAPGGATTTTTTEFSALSPVQIVARGDVKIGYFDVSRFIKSIGPFAKVGLARNFVCGCSMLAVRADEKGGAMGRR